MVAINCDIWFGDLARAIRELKPTDERSIAKIAGLLGFNFGGSEKLVNSSPSSPSIENAAKGRADQEAMQQWSESNENFPPIHPRDKAQDSNNLLEAKDKNMIYAIPSENILILLRSRKS